VGPAKVVNRTGSCAASRITSHDRSTGGGDGLGREDGRAGSVECLSDLNRSAWEVPDDILRESNIEETEVEAAYAAMGTWRTYPDRAVGSHPQRKNMGNREKKKLYAQRPRMFSAGSRMRRRLRKCVRALNK
jgi:hypothetical protein